MFLNYGFQVNIWFCRYPKDKKYTDFLKKVYFKMGVASGIIRTLGERGKGKTISDTRIGGKGCKLV